jgi:hypothetical protein
MGFLRGLAKGIVGIIFVFLLSALLMSVTLYEATNINVLKPLITTSLSKTLESQNILPTQNEAIEKCKTQSSYIPPIKDINITLDCEKIKSSPQNFSALMIDALFDQQLYNRQCDGLNCLKLQDVPGFATKSFNEFLKICLFVLCGVTVLFGLFLFLLSQGWPSKFSSLGIPFILNGIAGIPLEFYKSKIATGDFQILSDKIIGIILKYMYISLAIGIILVAIAISFSIAKKKLKGGKKKKK